MTSNELMDLAKRVGFVIPKQPDDWQPAWFGHEFDDSAKLLFRKFSDGIESRMLEWLCDELEKEFANPVKGLSKSSLIRRDYERSVLMISAIRSYAFDRYGNKDEAKS